MIQGLKKAFRVLIRMLKLVLKAKMVEPIGFMDI